MRAGLVEFEETGEIAGVVAVGEIDSALEAQLYVSRASEGLATVGNAAAVQRLHAVFEDLGVAAVETSEEPFALDEVVDEFAFDGISGAEVLVVPGGEAFEFGQVLIGEDAGNGVDAVFQGVSRRDGLARC